MDHELKSLDQFIEDARLKFNNRRELRESNFRDNIEYPSEILLEKSDTSIKKNSALVKRLRGYTESQKAQIIEEIDRLNSTKFISEVAQSLIEAKLKLNDLPSVIEICSKFNRSYRDFAKHLLEQYSRYLPQTRNAPSISPSKIQVDLRLFAELIIVGIITLKDGLPVLVNLLCYLMFYDKNAHQNASAILTFCKGCGDEFLGLVPRDMERLAAKHNKQLPASDLVNVKRQALIRSHIRDYYISLTKAVIGAHEDLCRLVLKNNKICKVKGDSSREFKELVEIRHSEFQKFYATVSNLGDVLGEDALVKLELVKIEGIDQNEELKIDPVTTDTFSSPSTPRGSSVWDDEGTRSFYEDLVDIKSSTPEPEVKPSKSSKIALTSSSLEYFSRLSNCVNRDMIDHAAEEFMRHSNTKFGRRKLIKVLFNVQRTRLDLLPFYARLTATLHPYVPNVGNELSNMLKVDFKNLFKKKDQINIESKVKNVRFIGELVKFNLFPKHEAINCLKMLLSDFTHHHIEMTCNLLETCGRLLYKLPEFHHQMRLILEQIMRKKMLLSVDSKYVTMIENAYYSINPPEVTKQVVEEPPMHVYIRYLLCECLNRSTIDKVLQKIKLLDWNDKSLAKFAINCMIEVHNLNFYNIRYLAALLAALNKDHPWISVLVIDGVVEDILLMLEINEAQFNQRRIPMIRYFGELYNYRLSDSPLVFRILYLLITYGVYYPEPNQTLNQIPLSRLDPPDNLFRIKLVCDLLDTCGQYFNSGQEKRKLDCFLLLFQRYYWYKRHIYTLLPYCMAKSGDQFPAATEYLYNDAIHNLRPDFQAATSYSEAVQSLQEFIGCIKVDQPLQTPGRETGPAEL